MSEITVNDLPNEIIIKVIQYLDQESLLNATLACKRWVMKILMDSSYIPPWRYFFSFLDGIFWSTLAVHGPWSYAIKIKLVISISRV